MAHGEAQVLRPVRQQHGVGGRRREEGAAPHRHRHRRRGERRGVVDAVADHRDDGAAGGELAHPRHLAFGRGAALPLLDAGGGGDPAHGSGFVAGEQQDAFARPAQVGDEGGALGPQRVVEEERPAHSPLAGEDHQRALARGEGGDLRR